MDSYRAITPADRKDGQTGYAGRTARRTGRLAALPARLLVLAVSLVALLPSDALARAGGGSFGFHSPSSGGSRSLGRGFGGLGGGHHFFFFGGGGGGGGGFLLLIILLVVAFLIFRAIRNRRG